MGLRWVAEEGSRWDADKLRIIGEAPAGIFDTRYRALRLGDAPPGSWWRVEDDGRTVGYGWLDACWGDAEILLAVDPAARTRGIGDFILQQLRDEARARGLNYLTNLVRPTHPEGARLTAWLKKRGFSPSEDGRLLSSASHQRAR